MFIKRTSTPADPPAAEPKPWQTWGGMTRYIIILVAIVILYVAVMWITHHYLQ